jgi:hypothetical protein
MIKQFFINPYSFKFKPEIFASVGTSTSPTSTGTKAVTGVGFEPKVVMPFNIANGTPTSIHSLLNFGVGVSPTSRAAIAVSSVYGAATSETKRRHDNLNVLTESFSASPAVVADLDSLDADGFTLDYSAVAASALQVNHICLGGADLEVSLTQHQMNNDNTPQSFSHGLSGAPTGLLFLHGVQPTTPPNTSTTAQFGVSMWDGTNQYAAYSYSADNVSTTNTGRSLSSNVVYSLFGGTKVVARTMSISNVDSTNVNCTYPITTTSASHYFWMLAIRGAKCQVGTFDCNGSLDPLTISTPGIVPKLFLPVMTAFGVDNINSVQNTAALMIGASDGANNVSCGITDQNGVTTTNARRYQSSNSLVEYNDTGTKVFEATASFDGENVIVNPSTNLVTTWGQGAYLVIGS